MRLALVISSLSGGGAERMMAELADAWVAQAAEVTLITLASRSEDDYPLRPEVVRVALGLTGASPNLLRALFANARRVLSLRRAIVNCRPSAVISFMTTTNLLVLLATAGLDAPVVVAERVFVEAHPPPGAWRALYRALYRRAAAVVAQTRRGAADLESRAGRAVHVIPNWVKAPDEAAPVRGTPHAAPPVRTEGRRVVLAAGRLQWQKGFDMLVEAFAQVAQRHPEWRLVILGEGTARAELTALISKRDMSELVSMPGYVRAPRSVMREADLFVLSSRYEGMPNALLEAMSEGLACVSFDCHTGPGEVIEHGINGWLVPAEDVRQLSVALDALMQDSELRERLAARARLVVSVYSHRRVMDLWNGLLKSVIDGRAGVGR